MYVSQSTGGANTSQITDTERARSTRIALWRHVTNHARGARLYGVPAKATLRVRAYPSTGSRRAPLCPCPVGGPADLKKQKNTEQ